jgi:hypothetical protein
LHAGPGAALSPAALGSQNLRSQDLLTPEEPAIFRPTSILIEEISRAMCGAESASLAALPCRAALARRWCACNKEKTVIQFVHCVR